MRLTLSSDQPSKTIDEFYQELASHGESVDQECGRAMLSLIANLRALPDEREVWALTSHYHMRLLSSDTYRSPWYVSVIAIGDQYSVEYRMPERLAPWPGAQVRGEADTEQEAVTMVMRAMDLSEGWLRAPTAA
jgi:hypothetical protein